MLQRVSARISGRGIRPVDRLGWNMLRELDEAVGCVSERRELRANVARAPNGGDVDSSNVVQLRLEVLLVRVERSCLCAHFVLRLSGTARKATRASGPTATAECLSHRP